MKARRVISASFSCPVPRILPKSLGMTTNQDGVEKESKKPTIAVQPDYCW